MNALLKDIVNLNNWRKAFGNPKRFIEIFDERINSFPGTKFGYTNSKIIKRFYMNFYLFFAKKNKNFKEFFFDVEPDKNNINTNFNLNNDYNINEEHFQSLKKNGIIILENALKKEEHNKISETFAKFKRDLDNDNLDDYNNKNFSTLQGPPLFNIFTIKSELNSESNLKKINDQITKKIYGKPIHPSRSFGIHKATSLPDNHIVGDNVWHADKYLPNLKLLYFPHGVNSDGAPFRYALGSHKINKDYGNFFINKVRDASIENSEEEKKFIKNTRIFDVPPNTLIAALTNGFHSRTPFKKEMDRCCVFIMYGKFKLSSLISYWKYN